MRWREKAGQAIFERPRELQFVLGGDYRRGFAVFVNLGPDQLTSCPHLFAKREEAVSDLCQALKEILKAHGVKHRTRSRKSLAPELYPSHLNVDLIGWLVKRLATEEVVELKDAPRHL